jgi:hypothetical protein
MKPEASRHTLVFTVFSPILSFVVGHLFHFFRANDLPIRTCQPFISSCGKASHQLTLQATSSSALAECYVKRDVWFILFNAMSSIYSSRIGHCHVSVWWQYLAPLVLNRTSAAKQLQSMQLSFALLPVLCCRWPESAPSDCAVLGVNVVTKI